jgi:hypothetical protein
MMRPAQVIDDRAVPEDRPHIGTPAPGYDFGRRRQYAEDGACVVAGARNVLGAADSTPACRVSADSDKDARPAWPATRASPAWRRVAEATGRRMAPGARCPGGVLTNCGNGSPQPIGGLQTRRRRTHDLRTPGTDPTGESRLGDPSTSWSTS